MFRNSPAVIFNPKYNKYAQLPDQFDIIGGTNLHIVSMGTAMSACRDSFPSWATLTGLMRARNHFSIRGHSPENQSTHSKFKQC